MLMFLDFRSSLRCLNLPLENTNLELNFRKINTVCYSAMHVNLTYCVVRLRLANSPRREDTSCIVNLFYALCHAVNRVSIKFFRLSSRMLSVRFLVLMRVPSLVREVGAKSFVVFLLEQ